MAPCIERKTLPQHAFTDKGRKRISGQTLDERLAYHTKAGPTCHLWTGKLNDLGRPMLYVAHDGKMWLVSHLVWIRRRKFIPKGNLIRHTCDNPACVRFEHFLLGTDKNNKEDSVERNRHSFGETHGCAKLSETAVRAILQDPRTYPEIAAQYGVGRTIIGSIKTGVKWKHLKEALDIRGRRAWRGTSHGSSQLTEHDVLAIRASSETGVALSAHYGISESSISLIRSRKHWGHIP